MGKRAKNSTQSNGGMNKEVIYIFIILLAVIILRNAWLCDDAYITFRTADNFINGYGLLHASVVDVYPDIFLFFYP